MQGISVCCFYILKVYYIHWLALVIFWFTTVLLKKRLESRWHPRGHSWQRTCLPVKELWVRSLGQEDPLEKEMAIHSSTISWKIPWTEEPGRLQSTGSQRVGHDWATSLHFTFGGFCHAPWDLISPSLSFTTNSSCLPGIELYFIM